MARTIIILLAGVAAAFVLIGTLTGSWWSYSAALADVDPVSAGSAADSVNEVRSVIGLRDAVLCRRESCAKVPLEMLERKVPWLRAGMAAYAAGIIAGGLFLVVGALALGRKGSRLLSQTALSASAAALGTGAAFIISTPEYTGMAMGISAFLYFAGVLLGSTAAITQLRVLSASTHTDTGAVSAEGTGTGAA